MTLYRSLILKADSLITLKILKVFAITLNLKDISITLGISYLESFQRKKKLICNRDCALDQDLECLVDEEELRHYLDSTRLFRLCKSL